MTNAAEVVIDGKTVGAVYFDTERLVGSFEYAEEWIETGYSISPIHLPLTKQIFSFPYLNPETYHGLPGALADTLPDDYGNAIINAWLIRNDRDVGSFTPVERLLYTGTRGMGALEYLPQMREQKVKPMDVNIAQLVELAQSVIDLRSDLNVEVSTEGLSEILQVGTSAGGARPKAVIALNSDRTHVVSGQVDVPQGYEHYLIKFDGVKERSSTAETFGDPAGYGRLEYAYYLAATEAGIDMMPCELLEEGDRAHFLTKRFDRDGNRKVHYQSLCAMDHADFKAPGLYSYEEAFSVMRRLRLPLNDAKEMLRRMVFNVIMRNQDDHSKNFGFVHKDGRWRLAPAFDVGFNYIPGNRWTERHNMTINGKQSDFEYSDLEAVVNTSAPLLAELPNIVDRVNSARDSVRRHMKECEVPKRLIDRVTGSLRNISKSGW
ncbi:type II toxin-antitoxin system HipA family toxin [Bacterioplanoides sp.]|uniref:type II toxin-antitoxin system HipA family toxin n=1 Tax=Bacterioplanoides sp. TaxID=2066072 RepID=UPI003AFF81A9